MNNQSFKSPTCRTSKGQPRSTFNSCDAAAQSAQYEAKNRGEWGGELSVRWPDGSTRSLIRDNTRALVPIGEQLFVFTGLAHLIGDTGAVWVVDDFDRAPRASRVTLLPSMPELVSIDPMSGEFLMVSSHAVMVPIATFGGRVSRALVRTCRTKATPRETDLHLQWRFVIDTDSPRA